MISPPLLKSGDKISIVAPAKTFDVEALKKGVEMIKGWGLTVQLGKNLFTAHHQYAGTDEQRLQDMQEALDDVDTKAIFCARGGYGTARIIDNLDFKAFKKYPKWICGFSDVTVWLAHLNHMGYQSIHSVMPTQLAMTTHEQSARALRNILFGQAPQYDFNYSDFNKLGSAEGALVGGNLTLLHCMIGTASEVSWQGKILFIEDIGEQLYHLDRMMVHLKRAGKLRDLAGLIVGHFTDMKDAGIDFGKCVEEIILDAVSDSQYPVIFNFPAGHASPNMPLIFGREIVMKVTKSNASIAYLEYSSECAL